MPTFILKFHVIGGKPYCHQPGTNLDSVPATEKFLMEKPNNTLPDLGIEPRALCSTVTLAATRPTRQSVQVNINNSVMSTLIVKCVGT